MSAAVITLGGIQCRTLIRRHTPVHLDDGHEGWIEGYEFASGETVALRHYIVHLTSNRGTVEVEPGKLVTLARNPLPAGALRPAIPQGAA